MAGVINKKGTLGNVVRHVPATLGCLFADRLPPPPVASILFATWKKL